MTAPDPAPSADQKRSADWERILSGEDPFLRKLRRFWRLVPTGPRCKMCAAPFHGLGKYATRIVLHGPSQVNPMLCNFCFSKLREQVGGAEVPITVLFADIRGSTGLAERIGPAEFRRLLQQMYRLSASAVDRHDGIVDKFLGDGVMALFLRLMTGEDHAGRAIAAAQDLLESAERSELREAGVRVGAGVQSGDAFVGVIGADDRLDFTALGDTVNVAARLGSIAGPGELLVGAATWDAEPRPFELTDRRTVEVSGRAEPLEIVALQIGSPEASTAA